MIARPGFFHDPSHLRTNEGFEIRGRPLTYGIMPDDRLPRATAAFRPSRALAISTHSVGAFDDSCTLGADYYDRPGEWDFIRNSEKAQTWRSWAECIDGLMSETASGEGCFVAMSLTYDSGDEYWDATARLECPE